MERTFELKPDYDAMHKQFSDELVSQFKAFFKHAPGASSAERAELMRDVQRWFAPLVIAAQTASTTDQVQAFRNGVLSDLLIWLDTQAGLLERAAEDEIPEGGEKGLL